MQSEFKATVSQFPPKTDCNQYAQKGIGGQDSHTHFSFYYTMKIDLVLEILVACKEGQERVSGGIVDLCCRDLMF